MYRHFKHKNQCEKEKSCSPALHILVEKIKFCHQMLFYKYKTFLITCLKSNISIIMMVHVPSKFAVVNV